MASVKVAVRVRPFNKREVSMSSRKVVTMRGATQVVLEDPSTLDQSGPASASAAKGHKFSFDYAYSSHDPGDPSFVNQERVYDDLGMDVVDNAFSGYNVCVFAYGQTGSGKTYTMMGTEEDRGLIPRICQTMFEKMQEGKEEGTTFRTEVSYLEIYNERVKDLLRKNSDHNLKVREHPVSGPYVQNLSKHLVMSYTDILALMETGNNVRTTASTNMNDTSSRSHAIFTIKFVNAGFCQGIPHETVSKIHLVDLAGSERADATGATGQRLKEGAHINKSLVTLGSVISALAEASQEKQKSKFIPYRDSVLTWLLKDSLGGNSKTIMIATISPAEVNYSEILSTLRYANRAKNIINKPTVNEDANVKLIRDLRDEINRLKSMMSLDPDTLSTVQAELALKEAEERHLTEQWTEKWKEAAKVLQEHRALALKRTGLGIVLDSDKPHLVGIDEDVLSTGITLYHLKEGDTVIGTEETKPDIALRGPCIEPSHCVINLKNGVATLVPSAEGALCMVNASSVAEPTRLSQGCVIVLGKTNMFRYNDPTEAANLRQQNRANGGANGINNKNHSAILANQSLLSQSFSDLRSAVGGGTLTPQPVSRTKKVIDPRLHSSEGDIQEEGSSMALSMTTSGTDRSDELSACDESLCDEHHPAANGSSVMPSPEATPGHNLATPGHTDSCATPPTKPSNKSSKMPEAEMNDLYRCICEQKDIIMLCLENETCDITTLNERIALLQNMQESYAKLEFELTRNMWVSQQPNQPSKIKASGSDPAEDGSFDEQFATLVEQEVDRRLFQEKVLRAESDFHERELLRIQKERELNDIRRQHEKEIYLLRKKMHETSPQQQTATGSDGSAEPQIRLAIPRFRVIRDHVEFEVAIFAKDASWTISRRFRQFRDLHQAMAQRFGASAVQSLFFPHRRLFGNMSDTVSEERQAQLQTYLNGLVRNCAALQSSPVHRKPYRAALVELSAFFEPENPELLE